VPPRSAPVLIEAMTYRIGHHSTSDDSTRYRGADEIEYWKTVDAPEHRLRMYLEERGYWSESEEKSFNKSIRKEILSSLQQAEARKKPSVEELFTDVYDDIPKHLQEQKKQLEEHLELHGIHYPLADYHK